MSDEKPLLTPEQSRAGRALLDWSQDELAKRASLSQSTIRDFEKGRRVPTLNNQKAIIDAFRDAGVSLIFDGFGSSIGGAGVRFIEATDEAKKAANLWRLERAILREMKHKDEYEGALRYYATTPTPSQSIASDFALRVKSAERGLQQVERRLEEIISEMSEALGYNVSRSKIDDFYAKFGEKEEESKSMRLIDLDDFKELKSRIDASHLVPPAPVDDEKP